MYIKKLDVSGMDCIIKKIVKMNKLVVRKLPPDFSEATFVSSFVQNDKVTSWYFCPGVKGCDF